MTPIVIVVKDEMAELQEAFRSRLRCWVWKRGRYSLVVDGRASWGWPIERTHYALYLQPLLVPWFLVVRERQ